MEYKDIASLIKAFGLVGFGFGIASVLALIIPVIIRSGAFLGNWTFSEISARNKIRRDFSAEAGKNIAALANQHYWGIANAAGTLSVGLRGYVEDVEIHLYYPWPTQQSLKDELERVARKTSFETFPSLVQLVWALHNFQFSGSNDYLLPDRSAGLHLRRLYNRFRKTIAERVDESDEDIATGILRNKHATEDGKLDLEAILEAASVCGERDGDFAPLKDAQMEQVRKGWASWLWCNLADVLIATETLEAFSRLLQQQLAELYQDWFRDRDAVHDLDRAAHAVEHRTWFGLLDRQAYATLALAREQPDFMLALRRSVEDSPYRRPADGLDQREPPTVQDEIMPPGGPPPGGPPPAALSEGTERAVNPGSKFDLPGGMPLP